MYQLSYQAFENNDDYYELLDNDIWLMDNHKWSFAIWNKECVSGKSYLLVHVDYHWDAVYDMWESRENEDMFLSSNEDEIAEIVREETLIRFDSFICPAIVKGFINEVHFFCLQGEESGDEAIHAEFIDRFGCDQVIHNSINSLSNIKTEKPILFDFCVDVFNRSNQFYGADIWSDNEVDELLEACKPLVVSADIVTISMSYGYSGSQDDTKRLTEKVVNTFGEWRNNS